jgi:hypothetical protein
MLADFLLIQGSHNRFPPDTAFPQIDVLSDGFKALCAIIAKYNVQSYFRLRLLHRHMTIPEGQILLGTSTTEPHGYWTRPTRICDIDLQKIHPHIISVNTASCTTEDEKRNALLFPSEFREGPAVSVGYINSNFFTEFTDCLWMKGLENTLGLEAIQGQAGKMIEFSFDTGSLLLKEAEVRGQFDSRQTGWTVTVKDGAVDKDGENRCVIAQGSHHPVTEIKVKGMLDALKILRDEGVLA